jgi:hypothetical protein
MGDDAGEEAGDARAPAIVDATDAARGCSFNTDCNAPLRCEFGRCHQTCMSSRDCPNQRCVQVNDSSEVIQPGACLLPDEVSCSKAADCHGIEVCGIDGQCRDPCMGPRDCLLRGQLCVSGTCADQAELDDRGMLSPKPDAG